jgi:hypothetical protein
LFLLLIPGAIIGWDENLHYLNVWQKRVVNNDHVGPKAGFNIHSFRNQSLANGVFLLSKAIGPSEAKADSGPSAGARALPLREPPGRIGHPSVRIAIAGILIALLAVGAIVGRRANSLDAFTGFGLACCATLIVSPLAWGHYFMVELPALLCVPIWLGRRGMARAARGAAVIPVMLSWSYYVAMPYVGGVGILGIGTAAWFLFACGLMLWAVLSDGGATSARAWVPHNSLAVPLGLRWVDREAIDLPGEPAARQMRPDPRHAEAAPTGESRVRLLPNDLG